MRIVYDFDFDDAQQRAVMFAVMDVMRYHAVEYESQTERDAARVAAETMHKIERDPTATFAELVFVIEPSTLKVRADLS